MSKKRIESSKAQSAASGFDEAIESLRRGDVIVFPTETLYGLGADALNNQAVEKVFQLKGRDPRNPIPVLVAHAEMLGVLVAHIPPLAQQVIDHFWPGPLTLVLSARENVSPRLLNPSGRIGVRISSQRTATDLVRALGRPLTATSANPSGKEPARDLTAARTYFADKIQIFLEGGKLKSKSGSTVVELHGDKIKIIREGEISAARLRRTVGKERVL